ncbi:MAG TPA: TauD/TfdA family dioxygenase [Pseudonocardiaceae bacterium]|jgi:L-asparagine oxygenase|nr:TauD/TfdA family dioxygenase [Pseudonocardiaceae bacterium]
MMSVVMDHGRTASAVTLDGVDSAAVAAVANELLTVAQGRLDTQEWVAAARDAWEHLPVNLRAAVRRFRRHSGPQGALILRGLPVEEHDVPDTPLVDGSVQRTATVPAAALVMIACGLGDPAAFLPEKSGALVHDVVPVPGKEEFQGNAGSVLLSFHNENAFHPHRPDYVMLLCLRPDYDRVAGLRTACIRQVLDQLSDTGRDALSSAEFTTMAPPSFGGAGGTAPHPVLFGAADDPDLRVDFAATTALTRRGTDALEELRQAFGQAAKTHYLLPGDLAIVDNHVTVHGRTAFQPRYDGQDRWLQRTFALTSLRRSRGSRPDDGHVLVD